MHGSDSQMLEQLPEVFDQMLLVPSSYYDRSSTGNLLAKVTYHVAQVTGAATDAVKIMVREGIFVIGLLSYLFYKYWQLTLIFIVDEKQQAITRRLIT